MKNFALLFRQPSFEYGPEDMKRLSQKWQAWVTAIAEQGKLAEQGPRLAPEGKVLKAGGVITDGPFVEIKERLGSFIVVRAADLDEATTLAHGCPSIDEGGSVEIRPIMGPGK